MANDLKFVTDLYEEHLDEAAFLFEQIELYRMDSEVGWVDLAEWESRLESHCDALVLGDRLALQLCVNQIKDGEAGNLYVALVVLFRHRIKSKIIEILTREDFTEQNRVHAATIAIRQELPSAWLNEFIDLFLSSSGKLVGILGCVFGFRRFPVEHVLLTKLDSNLEQGFEEIAWALGRIGTQESEAALSILLKSEIESVVETAAIALLRLGNSTPTKLALHRAHSEDWAQTVLAIAGGEKARNTLVDICKNSELVKSDLVAFGLLGDLAVVPALVDKLNNEDQKANAASALITITGAQLLTEEYVLDEVDEDELFDEELINLETDGELPKSGSGEPFGENIFGPSTDPLVWRKWMSEQKTNFSREFRWRMGQHYGPSALFACLVHANTPYPVRLLSYEELVIRYRMDVPFEANLPVHQQQRCLRSILEWVRKVENNFSGDRWVFAGVAI